MYGKFNGFEWFQMLRSGMADMFLCRMKARNTRYSMWNFIFRHFLNSYDSSGQICLVYRLIFITFLFLCIFFSFFFALLQTHSHQLFRWKLKKQETLALDQPLKKPNKRFLMNTRKFVFRHIQPNVMRCDMFSKLTIYFLSSYFYLSELRKRSRNSKLKYTSYFPKSSQ